MRELAAERSHAVLTDANVAPLYLEHLQLGDAPVLVVEPGEDAKSFTQLEAVLDFLCESDVDRGGVLFTLGGGVVSDLGGLAASLHLRGIDVVHVPTTLLAQVDASIGGKTAVNLRAGKNLAGAFHPPLEVLIDPSVLTTLPELEFQSGLGEVLKSALVGSPELLDLLEREVAGIQARDPQVLGQVVDACLEVKARVVAADEFESGERATLNLGHTFAHAIEHAAGFGRVPHGVAVGVGLALALEASERAGCLLDRDLPERVTGLLAALRLPASLAELEERFKLDWTTADLAGGLRHDKKARGGVPQFVLLERAGTARWGERLDQALLLELLALRT